MGPHYHSSNDKSTLLLYIDMLSIQKSISGFLFGVLTLCLVVSVTSQFDDVPDGIWTSRGYGFVMEVVDGTLNPLEETAISCVPNENLLYIIDGFQVDGDVANITALRFVPYFIFDRAESFQSGCANGTTPIKGDENYVRDALVDYDILDQTFAEHYAFFELRGIDWDMLTSEARATLTSNSTDDELLEAFKTILGPLQDSHVTVRDETGSLLFWSKPTGFVVQMEEEFEQQDAISDVANYTQTQVSRWIQIVDGYMEGGLNLDEANGIIWGRFSDANVGYIQLADFIPQDNEAFLAELDEVFLALADSDAIVFDIRIALGGSDRVALLVASHFTSERVLAFTKRARDGDGFTDPLEVFIEPGEPDYRHDGKVIVIVSDSTISAGETFTLAMAELPQTTLLGQNTAGALTELPKTLPNGWIFQASNEEYITPDGMVYEMVGIPPDVRPEADLLPLSEREAGIDSWLEQALDLALETDNEGSTSNAVKVFAAQSLLTCWAPLWVASAMWAIFF